VVHIYDAPVGGVGILRVRGAGRGWCGGPVLHRPRWIRAFRATSVVTAQAP